MIAEENIGVREDFGVSRSARRGVTTHAKNIGVAEHVLQANNRWLAERRECKAKLTMVDDAGLLHRC